MKIIHLSAESDPGPLAYRHIDEQYYDLCVRDTTTVFKPNGDILLIYLKDILPRGYCELAFNAFKVAVNNFERGSMNRARAAGVPQINARLTDGTLSKTSITPEHHPTFSLGYLDRGRLPYCRQTTFTANNPKLWQESLPFVSAVSEAFRNFAPEQWASQKAFIDRVHPDFVIPRTIFTSLTVNRSWRTAVHKDAGDFRSGLGCMAVVSSGQYEGCELIFPRYRVAVDMRTGGVCLADVHEYHGNAPLVGMRGQYLRIAAVFYAREKMAECGSREFELERAKAAGDKLSTRQASYTEKLF